MTITATHLTTGSNTTDNTSFATASVTPTAGRLLLLTAMLAAATAIGTPTVTGLGLTWQLVTSTATSGARGLYIYRAMGTPAAGAVTMSGGSLTLTAGVWSLSEFAGVDTSGTNGSGAIAQSFTSRPASSATVAEPFPAAATAGNAIVGATGQTGIASTWTPGSGYAELGQATVTGPLLSLLSEFAGTAQDQVRSTSSDSQALYVGGVELKAAPSANLNKLRLGANTVALRYGSAAVSKAYLGATQIWP